MRLRPRCRSLARGLSLTVTHAAVGGWNTLDVVGVLLFDMMTIYWFVLLIVKHRAER